MKEKKATLIFLDHALVLTKQVYADWHEVQAEYYAHYKANLEPLSYEEIINFLNEEYVRTRCHFPKKNSVNSLKVICKPFTQSFETTGQCRTLKIVTGHRRKEGNSDGMAETGADSGLGKRCPDPGWREEV